MDLPRYPACRKSLLENQNLTMNFAYVNHAKLVLSIEDAVCIVNLSKETALRFKENLLHHKIKRISNRKLTKYRGNLNNLVEEISH